MLLFSLQPQKLLKSSHLFLCIPISNLKVESKLLDHSDELLILKNQQNDPRRGVGLIVVKFMQLVPG